MIFKNQKLSTKVLIILLVISVIAIGANIFIGYMRLNDITDQTLNNTAEDLKTQMVDSLNAKEKVWLTNALQIANNPVIKKAMYEGDRETVINILNNYSETFRENTTFNNINVHLIDKKLNSFVRSWDPDTYGDNLDYSAAYQEVLNTKEPLVTPEMSPKGLRLKALYPVEYNGEFIGIVNFEGGLNSIKRTLLPNDIHFLYLLDNNYLNIATGIKDNTQINNYTLSQSDYNNEYLSHSQNNLNLRQAKESFFNGADYLTAAVDIKRFDGE